MLLESAEFRDLGVRAFKFRETAYSYLLYCTLRSLSAVYCCSHGKIHCHA